MGERIGGVATQPDEGAHRIGPALKRLRAEGVRNHWFNALGETVYRHVVVMERALEEPIVPMAEFFRDGFRRLLAVVWPEDRAPFRPLEKAGCRAVATVGYIRLLRR